MNDCSSWTDRSSAVTSGRSRSKRGPNAGSPSEREPARRSYPRRTVSPTPDGVTRRSSSSLSSDDLTADHRQISLSAGSNFSQRFSPDGDHIVFQSGRSGNAQIWLLDTVTGSERQLTTPPPGAEDRTPDWSPDGTEIVFLSSRDGPFQLWRTSVDGRTGPAAFRAGHPDGW